MKIHFFKDAAGFRAWLQKHHADRTEIWVGFYKKASGETGITYPAALDEALCFGWIDGVRRGIDARRYVNRFTPRKPASYWSAINIGHARRLITQGRMAPPGLAAFDRRDKKTAKRYSFENASRSLDPAHKKLFAANKKAWVFFQAQAPWYRRVASWWVSSAKKDETRSRRLATLIADSARERRVGAFAKNPNKPTLAKRPRKPKTR